MILRAKERLLRKAAIDKLSYKINGEYMISNKLPAFLKPEQDLINFIQTQKSSESNSLCLKIVEYAAEAKQCIKAGYTNPNQSIQEFTNNVLKSKEGLTHGGWHRTNSGIKFKDLETHIISNICQKNLSSKDKTIEIGAGKLEDNLSYLMQRIPQELRSTIEPTEVNNFYLRNANSLKRVDLCKMDESYKLSSINNIIGSSVLDTLSDSDLSIACKQIHATLKPGGVLIHFANISPFKDTIISSLRDLPFICFPWQNDDIFRGIMRIQKEKLLNFISVNQKISAVAVKFLKWYSNLTVSERELTLNSTIMRSVKICSDFSNWIEKMNPDGLEKVDNNDFFEDRTRKAITNIGLEILEFGFHSFGNCRDRNNNDEEGYNYFRSELGNLTKTNIYVLQPDKVYYSFKMHVIVAKKV